MGLEKTIAEEARSRLEDRIVEQDLKIEDLTNQLKAMTTKFLQYEMRNMLLIKRKAIDEQKIMD